MKKLHIINLGKMGGVERLFLQYINDVSDGSDDVICISNQIDPDILQQMPRQHVTFANRLFSRFRLKSPQFLRKHLLQKSVNASNADMIIVWDLVPRLTAKPRKAKLVYYDHGCSWRYPKNGKTLAFMAMLDGVISASRASSRVMQHRFNLPCLHKVVINRLVTPQGIDPAVRQLSQPVRIGTASRQVGLKGISVSLLMMKELLTRGHNVTLEIAGKGPDREAFEDLAQRLGIAERVRFSGFQHNIAEFFNRVDIYMSTPVTEPFGLSCMEALYFGVPVIFPFVDGQPEVIADKICGVGLAPKVSLSEHQQLTGINVNFPYQVYDPIKDDMTEPMLLSHIDCADAFEFLIQKENYQTYSENAKSWTMKHFDYAYFRHEIESSLTEIANTKNANQ